MAIIGFAHAPASVVDLLSLNASYNIIHLVVGLLGLPAGFLTAKPAAIATA